MTSDFGVIKAARPAVAYYPPGATLGPRVLGDFEFVWILAGAAEWRWLDGGQAFVLEPGTLLLTRPGMQEEYRWGRTRPTRHGYVHFGMSPPPEVGTWPLLRPVVAPGPLGGLLDYLLWLAEEPDEAWLAHTEQTVATLLRIFVAAPLPDRAFPPEPPALAAALDHVRDEWARQVRPISLAELAYAGAVSKEHLARLFRLRFGVGPVGALELVRLDRAETLLTRSNLGITEIGHSCGYGDPLHFSRRFRATYALSPRAYRQEGARMSPLAAAGLLPLARRLTAE